MNWLDNVRDFLQASDTKLDYLCSVLRSRDSQLNAFLFQCHIKLKKNPTGTADAVFTSDQFKNAVIQFRYELNKLGIQNNIWQATKAAAPSTQLHTKAISLAKELRLLERDLRKANLNKLEQRRQTIEVLSSEIEQLDKDALEQFVQAKSAEIKRVLGVGSTNEVFDGLAKSKAFLVLARIFINHSGETTQKNEARKAMQNSRQKAGLGSPPPERSVFAELGRIDCETYRSWLSLIDRWEAPIDEFMAQIVQYHNENRKT